MYGTPLMACSRITSVESIRILALAPGYEIETRTVGGATSGNWEIGSILIDRPPMNRMSREMTMANAGRCRNLANIKEVSYSAWFFRWERISLGGCSSYATLS